MKRKPSNLGKLILKGLKKADINQNELAKRCGTSRQNISGIIYGVTVPSAPLFAKIVNVLELEQIEALKAFFGSEVWNDFIKKTAEDVHKIITFP